MQDLNIPIVELLNNETFLEGFPNDVPDDTIIRSLCVDSRKIKNGDWFICLKGENFDGHDFINMAITSGAAGIIYDHGEVQFKGIKVADTTKFLGRLGNYWRNKVDPIVIAITGSNGKTSVKELVSFLLDKCSPGKVCQSSGNFNNLFGVPYTLLSLKSHHKFLVVEIGTNHPGEISPLSDLAEPDYSIITSVSHGHIGNFGSLESIAEEKSEIVSGMKPSGVLIVNPDLANSPIIRRKTAQRHLRLKTPDDSIQLIRNTEDGIDFSFKGETCHYPVCGLHQFQNLLLSYTLLGEVIQENSSPGLKEKALLELQNYRPVKGRLQKISNSIFNVWDDTYNANPASYREAINFISGVSRGSHIFGAFGMMGELGDFSHEAHVELGILAAQAGFSSVVFSAADEKIREAFQRGWESKSKSEIYTRGNSDQDILDGYNYLSSKMQKGDHLLVKGSRSTHMERILKHF